MKGESRVLTDNIYNMRYISLKNIKEGMVLGKDLYDENNKILLKKGFELNDMYVKLLKKLQYNGFYIEDSLSQNIEILNIINDKTKNETIKIIKKMFLVCDENRAENEQVNKLTELIIDIIEEVLENKDLLLNVVDLKIFDDYTYYHSTNVSIIALLIGVSLDLSRNQLYELCLSSLMHDMGKIFIPKIILNKQGKLTEKEFEIIKKHSILGYKHIKKIGAASKSVYLGVLDHHEKFDGSGYPNRKSGRKISLYGRIISIADVYDALTSDRPYRKGIPPSEAIEYIMGSAGSHFDPQIVKIFVSKIAPYPLGSCVQLSNGMKGIVVENHKELCLRPSVKIYNDDHNESYIINLNSDKDYINVTISRLISM